MATVVGINYTTKGSGEKVYTLHLSEEFASYYADANAGRGCSGKHVTTLYAGSFDCSNIKVGNEIEVFYDRAVSSKNGTYQPIKRIDVLK